MAATFGPCNGVLATAIERTNLGATATESGGVWTVTHTDKLIIAIGMAQQAGYSASYPGDWAVTFRTLVSDGHIIRHCDCFLVIETGAGTDVDYLATTQPTFEESKERPATTWRARLLTYGVID